MSLPLALFDRFERALDRASAAVTVVLGVALAAGLAFVA
jgi:hypothetical protein